MVRTPLRRGAALLFLSALLGPPAQALTVDCPHWGRLDAAQKESTVVSMIDERLASPRAKDYTSVNPVTLRKCLVGQTSNIVDAFEGECLKQNRRRLDEVLTGYIYSCVD